MRQLLLISSIVGMLMYAGYVSQGGVPVGDTSDGRPELSVLQTALESAGATLNEVTVTAWGEVPQTSSLKTARRALAWDGPSPAGELRELQVSTRHGQQFLTLRWVLKGSAMSTWNAKLQMAMSALPEAGIKVEWTVQVSGQATVDPPEISVARALGAVSATGLQPWSGPRSASLAGHTAKLPARATGVNIQAAARQDPIRKVSTVWVAWPALLQEY